jgi:ABC-type proline/glycine betaine transport system permease subunit
MPWWNPRYWQKRVWLILVAIVVIIAIVVGAVVGVQAKKSRYPEYSELSYSLAETCKSSPSLIILNLFRSTDELSCRWRRELL